MINIDKYTIGYDKYDESDGKSIAVTEVLNLKDLSYTFKIDGSFEEIRFLTPIEAIEKFGDHMSEELKNKILKR